MTSRENKKGGGPLRGKFDAEADMLNITRRVSLLEALQIPRIVAGGIAGILSEINGVPGDDDRRSGVFMDCFIEWRPCSFNLLYGIIK